MPEEKFWFRDGLGKYLLLKAQARTRCPVTGSTFYWFCSNPVERWWHDAYGRVYYEPVVYFSIPTATPPINPPDGYPHSAVWRQIERQRFASGEYKPVPLPPGLAAPPEHFLHLSVTETENDFVAYTPSEAYGQADRQVRLKYGKYLRKTFPELTDSDIHAAVVAFRAQLQRSTETLHFATDVETVNWIFETRLSACGSGNNPSCMYGKWGGQIVRPYHVYTESPDVAVAYLELHEEIIARTVVSTKNKTWVRAYAVDGEEATCQLLIDKLKELGYKRGTLDGCRLRILPERNYQPQLPYLDGDANRVTERDGWWIVSSDGAYICEHTDGTAAVSDRCPECENPEDNCTCTYCDCCDARCADGCDDCILCDACELCSEHDRCQCDRCENCNALLGRCACERCSECSELVDNCDCEAAEEEEETAATA